MLAATLGHCWSKLMRRDCGSIFQPCRHHRAPRPGAAPRHGGRMTSLRQAFRDVARLVDLAALDRGGRSRRCGGFAFEQRFAPSTMNSPGTVGRSCARDQVVEQGLNRCGVLGRPFHQRQRMLVAFHRRPRSQRPARDRRRDESFASGPPRRSSVHRSTAMEFAGCRRRAAP